MTRRALNADGTITLKSFSHWGAGDADAALREALARIDARNRAALAEWNRLSPEEQEQRNAAFEAKRQARAAQAAQWLAETEALGSGHPQSDEDLDAERPAFL